MIDKNVDHTKFPLIDVTTVDEWILLNGSDKSMVEWFINGEKLGELTGK